jgi:hypothetical protein
LIVDGAVSVSFPLFFTIAGPTRGTVVLSCDSAPTSCTIAENATGSDSLDSA